MSLYLLYTNSEAKWFLMTYQEESGGARVSISAWDLWDES